MSAAAERRPWSERKDVVFWRGGDTNVQRKIVAESSLVKDSGKADFLLLTWDKGSEDPEFKRSFVSLSDHCDFKYDPLPSGF